MGIPKDQIPPIVVPTGVANLPNSPHGLKRRTTDDPPLPRRTKSARNTLINALMCGSTRLFLSRARPITILLDNLDSPYCLGIISLYWTFYIILVTTDINCIIMYDFPLSRMSTEILCIGKQRIWPVGCRPI